MAKVLLFAGALIFLALGVTHGLLTFRDLSSPRSFTPTDERVRRAMQEATLALNRGTNVWEAWLGFNLSHSLGLVLFGGGLMAIAWFDFPIFARSPLIQVAAVAIAAAYLVLSLRFWFLGPVIGSGTGLACFLASALDLYVS